VRTTNHWQKLFALLHEVLELGKYSIVASNGDAQAGGWAGGCSRSSRDGDQWIVEWMEGQDG